VVVANDFARSLHSWPHPWPLWPTHPPATIRVLTVEPEPRISIPKNETSKSSDRTNWPTTKHVPQAVTYTN
jgi:hypothetical protein